MCKTMPHGHFTRSARTNRRDSYLSRGRQTRAARINKSRYKNTAVQKKLYKRRASTVGGRNRSAIATLGRQVKALQQRTWGELCKNIQSFGLINVSQVSAGTYALPNVDSAVSWLVNDFSNKCKVNHGYINASGGPELLPTGAATPTPATPMGNWLDVSNLPVASGGMQDQYNFSLIDNDTPSTQVYMPLSSFYVISFNMLRPANTGSYPIFAEVTFFRFKKRYKESTNRMLAMPNTTGCYRRTCVPYSTVGQGPIAQYKTSFNPQIHQKVKTLRVRLTPKYRDGEAGQADIFTVSKSFNFKFPNKPLRPECRDVDEENALETVIPLADQIWAVMSLSCSAQQAIDNRITCTVKRWNHWRDEAND